MPGYLDYLAQQIGSGVLDKASQELEHAIDTGRNVLLVGAPGTGKSLLLRHLCSKLERTGQHIPVLIPLRNTSRPRDIASEFVRIILTNLASGVYGKVLEVEPRLVNDIERLRVGSQTAERAASLQRVVKVLGASLPRGAMIILIAEGLDELSEPGEIARWLTDIADWAPTHFSVVVSTRPSSLIHRLRQDSNFFLVQLSDVLEGKHGTSDVFTRLETAQKLVERALDGAPADARWRDDMARLLCTIAVFRPVCQPLLESITGLGTVRVEQLIEGTSFIGSDEAGCLDFIHIAITQFVSRNLLIPQLQSVTQLEFGDEAAERDTKLKSGLIPRPDLTRVLGGSKTIVLGERGAGKTAVFRLLKQQSVEELSRLTNPDSLISDSLITTSDSPAEFFQRFTTNEIGISTTERFKAIWLLYIASLAAFAVPRGIHDTMLLSRRYKRLARAILHSSGNGHRIIDEGVVSRSLHKLRSFLPSKMTFTVGPVTVEPIWENERERRRANSQLSIHDFLEQTNDVLQKAGRNLLLVVDQIDEAFKYQRDLQEALVQSLFLAEASISRTTTIRLVILLRTDLYEIYDIQEKNKTVSRRLLLEWTSSDLLDLLVSRVFSNSQLEFVQEMLWTTAVDREMRNAAALAFAFPEAVEGMRFDDWLWTNLQNGNGRITARQVILFLNLARDKAGQHQQAGTFPLFSARSVTAAMTELSALSFEEVVNDFRVAPSFVRNCRAGKVTEFDVESVQHLFAHEDGPVAQQVDRLERLGFLERLVVNQDDLMLYRFRIPVLYTRWWDQSLA